MKIIIPTLLAGSAMASSILMVGSEFDQDVEVSGDQEGKRVSLSYRNFMAASLAERFIDLRGVGNLSRMVNRNLREYGCNCYPTSGKGAGLHQLKLGGAPLDAVDGVCAKYARIFSCIQADSGSDLVADYNDYPENHYQVNAQEGGNDIDPSLTAPDPSVLLDGNPHQTVQRCGQWSSFEHHVDDQFSVFCGPASDPGYASKPDNYCPKMVCEVSMSFVDALVEADPERFADPLQYWKDNKNDDSKYRAVCTQKGGEVESCCGSYPDARTPVVVGKQACCNEGTSYERKISIDNGDTC